MGCGCGTCQSCLVPGARPNRLAQRLQPTVDRLRQRLTTTGLRVYEVYLVWTKWSGDERGEGYETELRRAAIVPRPDVQDLSAVARTLMSAGTMPVGSVRVTEITQQLSIDVLMGKVLPPKSYFDGCRILQMGNSTTPASAMATDAERIGKSFPAVEERLPENVSFFYEIVEDSGLAPRMKFRLASTPFRRPGNFDWTVILERISEDRSRRAHSRIGPDED